MRTYNVAIDVEKRTRRAGSATFVGTVRFAIDAKTDKDATALAQILAQTIKASGLPQPGALTDPPWLETSCTAARCMK